MRIERNNLLAGCLFLIGLVAYAPPAAPQSLVVNSDPWQQRQEAGVAIPFRVVNGEIRLTLQEAIQFALQNNLDLSVSKISKEQSRLDYAAADTLYDYGLISSVSGAQNSVPTIDGLPVGLVSRSNNQNFRFGISRLLPTGGSLSLDFSNSRATTNYPLATVNPTYNANLGLTFSQPLLAGRGRKTTEAGLEVARLNTAISDESFELSVINTVTQAIDAYWSLVGAVEQLKVARQGLEQGKQLYEQSRLKVEGGLIPPLELVQSEFGVATRKEAVIVAQANVDNQADALRQLFSVRSRSYWNMPINPETRPELPADIAGMPKDLDRMVDLALKNRPEMRQQQLAQDILELNAYVSDQAIKPQLDLVVGYDLSGVGGTVIERDPVDGNVLSRTGGAEGALRQIINRDFYGWSVGLNFSYTLGNDAARARRDRSRLAVEQGQLQTEGLEVRILGEVHRAFRSLETARQALKSAQLSTSLAERNLEAEQLRFENGRSTSFRLVDIQTDLNNARSREVTAVTTYWQASAEVHRATGRLLEEMGIEIVDD